MSSILLLFMTTLTTIRSCWEQQGQCMKWILLALTIAQFSDAQECSQTFDTCQGIITSPFYPENYANNMDCVYTIRQSLGYSIILLFLDFQLEEDKTCDYDFVEIRDGDNSLSPVLGKRLCNVTLPLYVSSSRATMLIHFKTDNSKTFPGFKAFYTRECGGKFTGRFQRIKLDINAFDSNMICTYFINQPIGYHIHLSSFEFLPMDESCNHSVEILDGGSLTSPLLAKAFCNRSETLTLRTSQNIMLIRFKTNGEVYEGGFNALYSAECGDIFTAPQGVIKSHNYPDFHESDIDCVYNITQPVGYAIELSILNLKLYTTYSPNIVKLYDGGSQSSPLISSLTNEKPPLVFTSTQSAMLIVFQTNGFGTRKKFHATYTSECKGNFTTLRGQIVSPSYLHNDGNASNCVYVISQPSGYIIRLSLYEFEQKTQTACNFDYMEIHDGGLLTSPLLGSLTCNDTVLSDWTTTQNFMLIHLKTRGYTLNASYETAHCRYTFRTPESVITSPFYPNNYSNNMDCVYVISQPEGFLIRITFTDFNLGMQDSCDGDFVEIYDGKTLSSPLLGDRFCNTTVLTPVITSLHNVMMIRFKTDGSQTFRGFSASYTTANCGETFNTSHGTIVSPFYPDNYGDNMNCVYFIRSRVGYHIKLMFVDIRLGEQFSCTDFVEIRDGATLTSPLIATSCNATLPSVLRASGRELIINFQSDASGTSIGFNASFSTKECGGIFISGQGMITSPLYPNNYENNTICEYVISQPSGYEITLSFLDFQLEVAAKCSHDFVKIFDGNSPSSTLLGKFCNITVPFILRSTQNFMLIRFQTDSSMSEKGFNASYKANNFTDCRSTFTTPEQVITSPFYPHNYISNIECEYVISQPRGFLIRITFSDFQLGSHYSCDFNFVQIHNGGSMTSPLLGNRFCNNSLPPVLTSSQNVMLIHFKTDNSVTQRGFKASYVTAECGGNFDAPEGIISSPFYPDNYGNSMNCVYVISQPAGYPIILTFHYFSLGDTFSCTDFVEIFDGKAESSPLLGKFCNMTLPYILRSTQNVMLIRFQTDISIPNKGFNASYKAVNRQLSSNHLFAGVIGGITTGVLIVVIILLFTVKLYYKHVHSSLKIPGKNQIHEQVHVPVPSNNPIVERYSNSCHSDIYFEIIDCSMESQDDEHVEDTLCLTEQPEVQSGTPEDSINKTIFSISSKENEIGSIKPSDEHVHSSPRKNQIHEQVHVPVSPNNPIVERYSNSCHSGIYFEIIDCSMESQDDEHVEDALSLTEQPEVQSGTSEDSINESISSISSNENEIDSIKPSGRSCTAAYLHPIVNVIPLKARQTTAETIDSDSDSGEYLETIITQKRDLQHANGLEEQHIETDNASAPILLSVAWSSMSDI